MNECESKNGANAKLLLFTNSKFIFTDRELSFLVSSCLNNKHSNHIAEH